jgi:hypothetical protein
MKHFIVIQTIIEKQEFIENTNKVIIANIVRQIKAESEEAAIGKFFLATKDIDAFQKLDIDCYDLTNLKTVD